jgi:signal peptidase I
VVAATAAVVVGLRLFVITPFSIPSPSMEPTLMVGDAILVDKVSWRLAGIERGDVVVFRGEGGFAGVDPDHDFYVKRVLALPGDEVRAGTDGVLVVNGSRLAEGYTAGASVPFGPVTVPPDHLFVVGDNRAVSYDSRHRGPIPYSSVVGTVTAVHWPLEHARWLG